MAVKRRAQMHWSPESLEAREQAREEERRRLARELHDELGQALTGLKLHLSWLEQRVTDPSASDTSEVPARVQEMRELVDSAMRTLRAVITELRPEALDKLGLVAALEWQAETFARRAGLRCRFAVSGDAVELDTGRATSVFRVFQEMLTNVGRHARASRIDVAVEQRREWLVLTVRDNGRGFEARDTVSRSAYGLLGMRERAMLLGGDFDISSVPRRGTTVTLRIPLANRRIAPRAVN